MLVKHHSVEVGEGSRRNVGLPVVSQHTLACFSSCSHFLFWLLLYFSLLVEIYTLLEAMPICQLAIVC